MAYRNAVLLIVALLTTPKVLCAQDPPQPASSRLEAASGVAYNFNGGSAWSNLTPTVFLGYDLPLKRNHWHVRFGPTVSTATRSGDTASYFRSLMLPSNLNIVLQAYWQSHPFTTSGTVGLEPLNVVASISAGLKVLPSPTDTLVTILQHNVRLAVGLQLGPSLLLGVQFTKARHDLSNESEKNFKQVFGTSGTSLDYLGAQIQGYVPGLDTFIEITWRKAVNTSDFSKFADQDRVLTVGLRKDLNLLGITELRAKSTRP